jgi:hypothetical protein
VTGGAQLCSASSFICGPNFTTNRNKLLRSDQVLHCLQRTLQVDHPGFGGCEPIISTVRITQSACTTSARVVGDRKVFDHPNEI